jgi:glucokinase
MALTLGIDIGGTKIAAALVRNGEIIKKSERAYHRQSVIDDLATAINELDPERAVESVGIACAGLIDSENGMITFAGNLDFENFPLRDLLTPQIDREISLTNDASAAGWGEFCYGAGRSFSHMALIAVGTGIGGALILNRSLLLGAHGLGAELGHLNVPGATEKCPCGLIGCVEAVASGRAMERRALESGFASTQELADAARAGTKSAGALFDEMGWAIGAIAGRLTNVVDLQVLVIGGGFGATFDLWENGAQRGLRENIVVPALRSIPEFKRAQLGNDAGVIGVADFAYGKV